MISQSLPVRWFKGWWRAWSQEWNLPVPMDWRASLAVLAGGLLLYPLVSRLPLLGIDWFTYFYPRVFGGSYPPWTWWVLEPFQLLDWRQSYYLLSGITFMAVAVGTAREAKHDSLVGRLAAVAMAVFNPIILILLWQGNIDGLVLLGLFLFPPGVVVVLMKPGLAAWSVLARRRWFVWAAVFGLASLLVWGWWPGVLLADRSAERLAHPLAMGWTTMGWPLALIGLALLPFTNADPLRLMAVGSFLTPVVMPNHFYMLLPALGRVRSWRRLLLWGWVWLVGIMPGFAGDLKWVAWGFPFVVWWLLMPQKERT